MITGCQDLQEHIVDLVEGGLDRDAEERLRSHARACASCEHVLRLEERLVGALRDVPPTPCVDVPVPDPEPRPRMLRAPLRLAGAVALSAAAALLLTVAWLGGFDRTPHAEQEPRAVERVADSSRPIEIRTVIESSADAPLPDDGLLALTAGVEAVVMRRPAQGR